MWAYLDNEQNIEVFSELPANWKNISNFSSLQNNLQRLRELGWYPIVDDTVPITNDFLQYHAMPTYSLDTSLGVVRQHSEVVIYSPAPSNESLFQAQRDAFFANLRQTRNSLLADTDWTQLADIQKMQSDQWQQQWQDYRQALRDLPNVYATVDNEKVVDINQIVWPTKPTKHTL